MNYEQIMLHLLPGCFEVQSIAMNGKECLLVSVQIAGDEVELIHFCEVDMFHLPVFYLKDPEKYGVLAHVISTKEVNISFICVNDLDSVSVNFERPELAFEVSLERHVAQLEKAIGDPDWNRNELLREFKVNWGRGDSTMGWPLLCSSKSGQLEKMTIFSPPNEVGFAEFMVALFGRPLAGVDTSYIGISKSNKDLNAESYLKGNSKRKQDNGIGYVIPLASLAPAPTSASELGKWYIDAVKNIKTEYEIEFHKHYVAFHAIEFWLVFNAPTPSGTTWFGLKLTGKKKAALPCKMTELTNWQIERFVVDVFNKELLMPRSGAKPNLDSKSALLIGCGSVGSELAMKLGSAGVGKVHLYDPETFTISNLYRHTLSKNYIGTLKSVALADELTMRYPWVKAKGAPDSLLDFKAKEALLNSYDLIIVAIGSPTHERLFHQFMAEKKIKTPVINTWLEGYGIGGHATLDIPDSKGCLRCAYVENDTGARGLAANLNFFETNQNIVQNYAGCGETFIPYGAISSAQTALIAADLAVKYLEGKITTSKKVSWKGDSADAIEQGIKLTPRYNSFNKSLIVTPLYNPRCDVCCGEASISYKGDGLTVNVTQDVVDRWQGYRQLERDDVESAGLLIGHRQSDGVIWIDGMTTPKTTDTNKRAYFKLDDEAHQTELADAFAESQHSRGYLGTWHTHPEDYPTPSKLDKKDWRKHVKENKDRSLLFVIIGLQSLKIFTSSSGKFITLQLVAE